MVETEIAHLYLNRAMLLSILYNRYDKKRTSEEEETEISLNKKYIKNYKKLRKMCSKEIWNINYDNFTYENYSILQKYNDKLIIQKNEKEIELDIPKIKAMKCSTKTMWGYVAVPAGIITGFIVGFFASDLFHYDFSNSLYGAAAGFGFGLLFGIGINEGSTKTYEIKLQSLNAYDKYWELDRQTYFAIPNSENDKTIEFMDNQ